MSIHNAKNTCLSCPAMKREVLVPSTVEGLVPSTVQCRRRPSLQPFDPSSVTFDQCPEWQKTDYGYLLKKMRVVILGIDGYLGWSLALKLAKLGCEVSGIDNFARRRWVKEQGSYSMVPILSMKERIQAARKQLGVQIRFFKMNMLDHVRLKSIFKKIQPEAVVHYGENPSGPYSMKDVAHAVSVQHNNVIGTLGLLFVMKDVCPESSLIKLGTMGEYGTPMSGRPIFEGYFPNDATLKWQDHEWSLGAELTPRDPGSFYHISKVQDTINIHKACKFWNLRSVDVMQGVIYGVHTDETASNDKLRTRFDTDECFGTVVNRMVAQAVIDFPLTVYGKGEQIRGFIALSDAMQCMTRILTKPPLAGQYAVVNQLSESYSMQQIAAMVAKVGKEKFQIDVKIQYLENPRVEAAKHPYIPMHSKLKEDYGFIEQGEIEEEIERMFTLLLQPKIKKRIEAKRDLILPSTWWSGNKRPVRELNSK